jgi:hypothetical protein
MTLTGSASLPTKKRAGIKFQPDMVARRGFEPLISALRGRCPRPLDERATFPIGTLGYSKSDSLAQTRSFASRSCTTTR